MNEVTMPKYGYIAGDYPIRFDLMTGESWILARDYNGDGTARGAMWIRIKEEQA